MPNQDLQLTKPPTISAHMLIRRPAAEVFDAFANPEVTTRFWFTHASAPLEAGKSVTWEWEMYGVSAQVDVRALEPGRRILIDWGDRAGGMTRAEWTFAAHGDTTFVTIGESGYTGGADAMVARAIDAMGGFSLVLAAAKAWLEHGIVLTLVADHAPPKPDAA